MDNKHYSQDFSNDSIRRFLLGQLPAGEQTLFEEQLFINGELEARVRLAEFELSDDYAFKRLTEMESASFREKYLLTADRNQMLNVSRAMRDRFMSEEVSETKSAIYQRLMPLLDLRRPAWRYAFATFILILILGTVFLVTKEPQVVRSFIPERFRSRPHTSPTPQLMNHSIGSSSPVHDEPSPPAAPHESPLIVPLNAMSSLDQSQLIIVPADANAVIRFQLLPGEALRGVYRAELQKTSGETLFSSESLKPYVAKPASIDFDVPAKDLKSGQYQIRLSRTDDPARQKGSQYYFRVQ